MEILSKDFKITCGIKKAYSRVVVEQNDAGEDVEVEKLYVTGLASSTALDLEGERMAQSAIVAFKRAVEEGMVLRNGAWSQIPLRSGHNTEWDQILGWIVEAEIDKDFNLFITAELDTANNKAALLYRNLTTPTKKGRPVLMGLSVGGRVVSAGHEWDEAVQAYVKTYYEVKLKEVSVVSDPANPETYISALAKSVDWEKVRGRTRLVEDEEEWFMEEENVDKSAEEAVTVETEDAEVEKADVSGESGEQVEKTDAAEEAEAVVEKAEEVAGDEGGEAEEVAKTDPNAELRDQLVEVAKSVGLLNEAVAAIQAQLAALGEEAASTAEAETTKSEEAAVEETHTVEKDEAVAEEDAVEKRVGLSVEDIASVIKAAIGEAVAPLAERIESLEKEPIDKSISVLKAGEREEDVLTKYERETEKLSGVEALRAALTFGG